MHYLFRLIVGDVRMIMRIMGHKIFNRKLKINSMSIGLGNVDYIMTQKDHKCRYQNCDFHLLTPPPFRI